MIRIPIKQPVFHGSRVRPRFFFRGEKLDSASLGPWGCQSLGCHALSVWRKFTDENSSRFFPSLKLTSNFAPGNQERRLETSPGIFWGWYFSTDLSERYRKRGIFASAWGSFSVSSGSDRGFSQGGDAWEKLTQGCFATIGCYYWHVTWHDETPKKNGFDWQIGDNSKWWKW